MAERREQASEHEFCAQCWADHCKARGIDVAKWKKSFNFCVCPHPQCYNIVRFKRFSKDVKVNREVLGL